MLLCHRIKQFREYNNLDYKILAEVLGISENEYKDFESNKAIPTIDIITTLAKLYKVTVDEFRGNVPLLTLHSKENDMFFDDVSENILKMSDLSWDETELLLYYRLHKDDDKDEIIKKILEREEQEQE